MRKSLFSSIIISIILIGGCKLPGPESDDALNFLMEYGTTFTISGTVSGYNGSGLVLQNNGGDDLAITNNGAFVFETPVQNKTKYEVTIADQPAGQFCKLKNNSGTVNSQDVDDIAVTCSINGFCGDLGNAVYDSQITVNGPAKSGVIAANQERAYSVDITNNSLHFIMLYGTTSPTFDSELYMCDQDGATQLTASHYYPATQPELTGGNFSPNGKYYLVAAGNGASAGDYKMKIINTVVSGGGSCNVPTDGCNDFDSDYIGGSATCTAIGGSWSATQDCATVNATMTRVGSCTIPNYSSSIEQGFVTISAYSTDYNPAGFKSICDLSFGNNNYIWDP